MRITDRLGEGVRTALGAAGLPAVTDLVWEVPRQTEHGDYATNVAMTLARETRQAPRKIAEAIVRHFPALPEVDRLEVAGPGFVNVFLSHAWCASALREVLAAGPAYGRGDRHRGQRARLEFVSANPTGPLVIVNARAAAVGDALAHLLRAQGAEVTTEYYVNDSGNQFEALARSFRARVLQQLGVDEPLPDSGYPGEYLVDLAKQYLAEHPAVRRDRTAQAQAQAADPQALARLGRWAVDRIVDGQRRVLADYGVAFDVWTSEQGDVRDAGLPAQVIEELRKRHLTYEALEGESDDRAPARPPRAQPPRADAPALWFRASQYGDEKDRVLRKSSGEPTYFAVDIAFHHALKFADFDRVITLIGPDHHGYLARMRAALQALGHPPEAFEILIIQLVTLLRDGEPVRMSKRRGEFVLMEELLEEVGRDAARFTFLMRRHDSPLDFDLAVATRQSADNPVYYVQYAHARVRSLFRQAAEQGMAAPPWSEVILARLLLPEEQQIIKHLAQYPELVASAARALEPHRIAYWLYELAGLFHPYYKNHRVLQPDHELALARLALCAGVGRVVANGLALLGVSAPESM